ncbi:MAG: regulatory protein RecX [Dorea sp.]|nr:regulatory protein RecX [Dorea sp.]
MVVTKIEPITKTRFRIYADENEKPLFVLYKGELSRYHIAVGEEISGDVYEEIYRNVIVKRAKARALHLLNDMGRTEAQLRRKLTTGGYTEEAAEEAIAYVKSFGYLNDWEYARSFIEGRKNRKSRRELGAALCQKGIGREEAERALEEFYDTEDSEAAVRELLRKKKFDLKTADYVQTQKMAGYLMRKGFRYDEIRRVLEVNEAF